MALIEELRKVAATPPRTSSLWDCTVAASAADEIERLRAACDLVRKNLNTQQNGDDGWMSEFEKLAFK